MNLIEFVSRERFIVDWITAYYIMIPGRWVILTTEVDLPIWKNLRTDGCNFRSWNWIYITISDIQILESYYYFFFYEHPAIAVIIQILEKSRFVYISAIYSSSLTTFLSLLTSLVHLWWSSFDHKFLCLGSIF